MVDRCMRTRGCSYWVLLFESLLHGQSHRIAVHIIEGGGHINDITVSRS